MYTGDIRLHGTRPDMTEDFVKKAAEVDPIALLCEGTRITDPETDESEQKVYNDCNTQVKDNNGLVIADFNFKDMDRMRTFYDIAKDKERKFVVYINNVAYLKQLSKDPQLGIPDFSDEHIAIFKPLKSSWSKSQKELFDEPNLITADDVIKNQDKMICAFSFWNFGCLIDIKPASNSLYIHSASEPWDDEGESDKKRVNLWLDHFDLTRLQSHCSGHSKGSYLLEVVKTIDSKMLYPIHTEHPDSYKKVTDKLTIVQEAKKYDIS